MQRVTQSCAAFPPPRLLVLLVYGTLGSAAIATAQSPGTFVQTSNLTTARSQHSATLLPNGHVLIAGGAAGGALASAEVYEPGAGSFRAVGAMTTARRMHTATLLPDDRVLIVGGYDERDALATAELFDPGTGTFSATGSLSTARGGHSAILLPTGAVLIIGGYGTRAYPDLAPAEIYDPALGTFRAAGAYVGRGGCDFCAPAVLLHDGTVYVYRTVAGPSVRPGQRLLQSERSDNFRGVRGGNPHDRTRIVGGRRGFRPSRDRRTLRPGDSYVRPHPRHGVTTRLAYAQLPTERHDSSGGRRNG
jgi:hypothetical protein